MEWLKYVRKAREEELETIIKEEKLKDLETRKFMENAFRDGEIKTAGTEIDRLMPPVSRFAGGKREEKKERVIDRLMAFFQMFYGIGGAYALDEKADPDLLYPPIEESSGHAAESKKFYDAE